MYLSDLLSTNKFYSKTLQHLSIDLLLSSDPGCISLFVLLDLSAAFDTFDHNILLNGLCWHLWNCIEWFKQYLTIKQSSLLQ